MSIDAGLRNVVDYTSNHPWLLISALLCCVLVYFLSLFFNGEKKGENPFEHDNRRPHEPFEHDHKARDAIIKQRYKFSKVPQDLDVIIVGSGVGGLSAGVLLARAGKKCLVLEQHDQAGGCCHSFVDKGFEFDTGIHYIGNMQDGSIDRTLLDQLTSGQLRWAQLDDAFDTAAIGPPGSARKYPMKSGQKRFIQNLIDMFPEEKVAIEKYMDMVLDCAPTILAIAALKVLPKILVRVLIVTGLYRLVFKCYRKGYTDTTVQEVLDGITTNKDLQFVLSYLWGDYGIVPKEAPFLLHSILVKHYMGGAYYPVNGTSEIAYHMCQVIQKAGGQVLVQAPVAKILCNDTGEAFAVQMAKTNDVIDATIIISNAGVANTFKTLLPKEVAQKSCVYPLIDKVGPSVSFITTFIGLEGDSDDLKLPAGNFWYLRANDVHECMNDFISVASEDLEDADIPLGYISFPSTKDPEWKKKFPGKSAALVITLAKWDWFKEWKSEKLKHRGDRYEAIKDSIGRKMWQQCLELFPHLDGKMVYLDVGTPVTNQHYLSSPEGEMYGLGHGKSRFSGESVIKLRPDTDIPGLYLTGQDMFTCGFLPAVLTGLLCASQILNRYLYLDLISLHKGLKKKGLLKPLTERKND